MDNLIVYNSSINWFDILGSAPEPFLATSQLFVYMLQLLLLFIILLVMSLHIKTKAWITSLVDYRGIQKANTPRHSNTWDEDTIQRSLQELGQKLEDMVLIPNLFVSWAAKPPPINPHYQKMKNEAEQWFRK